MTVDVKKYSGFLDKVAGDIDISPSKYQDAVDRYKAVGRWLEEGVYTECSGELSIYPQGSFRLGTVVRPIRGGVEASYDIDLVCEMPVEKENTTPHTIKSLVGERIKEHGTYRKLMDDEGKRCWTLEYAEEDGVGFHLDVLPAVPDPSSLSDTSIAITNKAESTYSWSASDSRGYGVWFDNKNQAAFEFALSEQKKSIQARVPDIYARVDDVPDRLVRTPLQRSIQLMKRHREVKFNQEQVNGYAPISIIITTLSAHFYQNEPDTFTALKNIVEKLHAHAVLVENRPVDTSIAAISPIKRTQDGKWYIGNPVNPDENFADRWHEDNHARAKAFFSWVTALKEDFVNIIQETRPDVIRKNLSTALGAAIVTGHFDIIAPVKAAVVEAPKIHISGGAKPWREGVGNDFSDQIAALQNVHKGLISIVKADNETVISGPLPFEASVEGYETITESFDIDLIIPANYPEVLPRVRETGKKIDDDYDHLYQDRTLCLAVPIEERRLYLEQPSLLGFVNKLLIPYLYGYCYWKKYQKHPFDESEHGHQGIVQHYMDLLQLKDEASTLSVISYVYEHGYRGHHPCPCGSGKKVRRCHGETLRALNEQHSDYTLKYDFISVLEACLKKIEKGQINIPEPLRRQVLRILNKSKD